jgi:endonuclease/exonuclease/phosphatase family metal-dependent hydrolase
VTGQARSRRAAPTEHLPLLCALVLIFWLWLDFNGLLLSVISTCFFFGMKGTPFLEARIGVIALLTFSSPAVYALLLSRRAFRGALQLLIGLQLACYLACALVRDPEVFAAATLLGRFVSGVAVIALLRRFGEFPHAELPAFGILLAFLVYLWARLLNDGLLTALHPAAGSAAALAGLFCVAMASRGAPPVVPARGERADISLQLSTVAFVLLVDVCIAMIFNFALWSARTPSVHASVYSLSFGVGALAGFLAARQLAHRPRLLPLALGTGAAGLACGLLVVLRPSYTLALGLLAHAAGCYGLAVFWYLFARRFGDHAGRRPGVLPLAGLQVSNLASLAILAHFLTTAGPTGFWLAFGLGIPLICAVELARPLRVTASPRGRLAPAWLAALLLPAIGTLFYLLPSDQGAAPRAAERPLSVLTTNVRYGWTDDYRFEPDRHLRWLEEHPADVVGMQEVNRGNFYGAFTDLYQYYRARLPGVAVYGDASFGFGNALLTRLPIQEWRVVPYRQHDMIRRSFTWARLDCGGRDVEVFVTHVSHHPHPNPIRQAQVAELLRWIGASERPWILMGDMNAQPDEPEIQALLEVAHPVLRERPELLSAPTHPALEPTQRLDYVFFSEHFDLLEQQVLDVRGSSDHRPVYVVLRLVR